MRILVAPDKFAGTLSAPEAAEAIADGWRRSRDGDSIRLVPLSDGGPGFLEVLHRALGGRPVECTVTGPLGDPVPAGWLQCGGTAYVESAAACGLHLMPVQRRDPWRATTAGVGELIADAVAAGVRRIVVGLGGSGTNDGGRGALEALAGCPLEDVDLLIASDVDNPLLGPEGATYGYGRQKGAREVDLPGLEERMSRWAQRRPDLASAAGAGAAGGLGFGLLCVGARRVPGIETVLAAVGFPQLCADSDLVLTGEGKFDWQSLHGKVVSGVLAAAAPTPVVVLAGQAQTVPDPVTVFSVAEFVGGVDRALADPAGSLAALAGHVADGY